MPEQDPHAATARLRDEALDRVEHARRRATPFRHGWPTTGHVAGAAAGAQHVDVSSSCGTRHGRQRTAGTVGANSDTTGVPTAAARCAGPVLPTTTASGACEHARQLGQRRPSAEVGRDVAGHERGQLALARPAGDHDACPRVVQRLRRAPRRAPAPTPAPGREAPGCTTT